MTLRRLKAFIAAHRLIGPGDLALVGVSGGPDSVFLLRALSEIAPELGARLHVVHLDHALRGEESAEDARFTASLAGSLGIPCTVERRRVSDSPPGGASLQERARRVRMAFFAEVRERLGAACVALGHTADDQAETLLLRLIAGGGPGALGGIRPRGPDGVVHPILAFTRAQILSWLARRGQPFRTDSSNLRGKYLRNRLRRELMPAVASLNPSFPRHAAAISALLADDHMLLQQQAMESYPGLAAAEGPDVVLDAGALASLPPPLARRILVEAAVTAGVRPKDFRALHVQGMMELAARSAAARLSLPGGIVASVEGGRLRLGHPRAAGPRDFEVIVALPGLTRVPALGLTVTAEACAPGEAFPAGRDSVLIDADTLSGPLRVRTRRDGDRFRPLGLGHRQKLQDYLVNARVPRERRDRLPILADDEKIVWVGGMRLDERARVSASTRRAWRLVLSPEVPGA